eukprot:7470248-Ditylum_brightwellii.AAC.1
MEALSLPALSGDGDEEHEDLASASSSVAKQELLSETQTVVASNVSNKAIGSFNNKGRSKVATIPNSIKSPDRLGPA